MKRSRREFLVTMGGGIAVAPFAQNVSPPKNLHIVSESSGGLKPTDLSYKGIIRLPRNGIFYFSQGALALRRVSGMPRLFVCGGHGYGLDGHGVVELTAPASGSNWTNVAAAPQASILTEWSDCYHGKRLIGNPGGPTTKGLWWDESGQRLFWAYKDGYSAGWWNPSIGVSTLDNPASGSSTAYGPWRTAQHSQLTHGWMMPVPPAFAAAHCPGKLMAVGAPPNSGDQANGGAVLFASALPANNTAPDSPAETSSSPHVTIAQTPLTFFDTVRRQPRPLNAGPTKVCTWTYGDLNPAHAELFPITGDFGPTALGHPEFSINIDSWGAAAWIDTPTKSGVIYFGQICGTIPNWNYGLDPGVCHVWYEDHETCPHGQHSEVWQSTGPGAATMVPYFCIFDPADLAKVAHGTLSPSAIRPTFFAPLRTIMPINPECIRLFSFGGAAFDSVSRLLYVSQTVEDLIDPNNPQPIIHVFQVS